MEITTALTADVLVIGFGKGGKTAAHVLAEAGRRVVMVERSENMYGGTCPNVGCVPTKMLVHYADAKRLKDDAQEFFAQSIAGVRALTSAFRAGNFEALNGRGTATVITGTARFVDPYTVAVGEGPDLVTVTAPTILVNTGSEPVIPPIPGLASSPTWSPARNSPARRTCPSVSSFWEADTSAWSSRGSTGTSAAR